ncbi:MAG TPA: PIN domain-containing protein [Vicinamibacterales bacterium]|nr:PIN domain-containing protein [Vicinamibacterales bacterium]
MTRTAIDSSSLIGYLAGRDRADTRLVHAALERGDAVLPPVVVTEVLSQPGLPTPVVDLIRSVTQLPVTDGYWERAGDARARLLAKGRRAPLADALIAQACIDHDVPLVTHDADFRQFAAVTTLRVLP